MPFLMLQLCFCLFQVLCDVWRVLWSPCEPRTLTKPRQRQFMQYETTHFTNYTNKYLHYNNNNKRNRVRAYHTPQSLPDVVACALLLWRRAAQTYLFSLSPHAPPRQIQNKNIACRPPVSPNAMRAGRTKAKATSQTMQTVDSRLAKNKERKQQPPCRDTLLGVYVMWRWRIEWMHIPQWCATPQSVPNT